MAPLPPSLVGELSMFLQIGVLAFSGTLVLLIRRSLLLRRWDPWSIGLFAYAGGILILGIASLTAGNNPTAARAAMIAYMVLEYYAAVSFIAGARRRSDRRPWSSAAIATAAVLCSVAVINLWFAPDFVTKYTVHGFGLAVLFGWAAFEALRARERRPGIGHAVVALACILLSLDYGQYAALRLLGIHLADAYVGIDAYVTMLSNVVLGFGIVIVSADRSQQRLRDLAISDQLSGLRNRIAFANAVQLAPPRGTIVMIDLDRLKYINDHYGHRSGDRAIAAVGMGLSKIVPSPANAFRIGGDEFAAIFPGAPPGEVDAMLERLNSELTDALDPERGRLDPLAISWGVAAFDENTPIDRAMSQADSALYERKVAHAERSLSRSE